jgi:hypothetical protein
MAGQYSRALLKFRSTYGEGLFDPGDAYEDENVIILHGRHALLTWTAVVAKDTGRMSMSIANLGRTYAEFGQCTPNQQ